LTRPEACLTLQSRSWLETPPEGGQPRHIRSLTLKGFKRFAHASVNLEGPTTAIVGPNEVGKSSLLDALVRLNDDEADPRAAFRGE